MIRWSYIFSSFGLLIISSYLDNVRGPLLPVLEKQLVLNHQATSWFLIAGNISSVVATFTILPLLRRFSEKAISLGVCGLGACATTFALVTDSYPRLIALAVLLGAAVAASGAMCNLLLFRGSSFERRSRLLCGLHMMYGFGSLLAPELVAAFIRWGVPWADVILVAGAAYLILSLNLMRLPREPEPSREATAASRIHPLQWWFVSVFCLYVAAEVLLSMWMVTYLVESRHLPLDGATRYLSGFFLMMGVSRLLCFLSLPKRAEKIILWMSIVVPLGALFAGFSERLWGFALAGLMGPFFPLFLSRMSRRFSPEQGARLTLVMLTAVQFTLAISHLGMGRLMDVVGVRAGYGIPAGLLCLLCGVMFVHERLETR